MVRLLFIGLILIGSTTIYAQQSEIDSLNTVLIQVGDDTLRVKTLNRIGELYLNIDVERAISYGNQAYQLSKRLNYPKGEGQALKVIGLGNAYTSNYIGADSLFKESLARFQSINYKDGVSSILNNLGSLNYSTGQYSTSIDYHLQSLKIAEEINNKMRIGTNLNNIGTVYSDSPDTRDKALQYYLRALKYFNEEQYSDGIATVSVNIGEDYFRRGNYDSALTYFKTSAQLFEGTTDAAYALTYIANIYSQNGDFANALNYNEQAISVTEKLGAKSELAQSLLGLGLTQTRQGKNKEAIATTLKALQLAQDVGAKQEIKQSYEVLADLYAKINDFKNAYQFESLLTNIKDTLYNSDEAKKIQQLQFDADIEKKESQIQLQGATIQRQRIVTYATGISGFLLLLLAVGSYNRYKFVRKTNKIIKDERDRSKSLLLNILPEETAQELETQGTAQTRYYEEVSVLFTDFKGFSTIAGKLSPQELVAELNTYFMAFDEIVERFNLEKIKTIGDAYMCAGGIPTRNQTHSLDAVNAALAMQEFMQNKKEERLQKGLDYWELRIGIHTGPVIAGVVGKKKYAYDIWGDTVNIASRMESNGEPGKVNVSSATFERIKQTYQCIHRGKISAKNIGEIDMYFIDKKAL